MSNIKEKLTFYEFILGAIIVILTIIGIIMILSSTIFNPSNPVELNTSIIIKQSFIAILGIGLLIFISTSNSVFNIIRSYVPLIMAFTFMILVSVYIFGKDINGAKRWINLPIINFSFQPSELAKIVVILYTAYYIEKYLNKSEKSIIWYLFFKKFFFHLAIIFGLIAFQPDLSTAVLVILTPITLLFIEIKDLKIKHIFLMMIFGIILLSILAKIEPYRWERIKSFYSGDNKEATNYQQWLTTIIIADGNIIKPNFKKSYKIGLPAKSNDFIFALIAEQLGFVLSTFVILLYMILSLIGFKLYFILKETFNKLVVLGIILSISFYTLIHLFVVLSIIPTTGIPLPFISSGGSSLIINMIAMGIVFNIINREKQLIEEYQEESTPIKSVYTEKIEKDLEYENIY